MSEKLTDLDLAQSLWKVWSDGDCEDDAIDVYAEEADDAAIKWAEKCDENDGYSIVKSGRVDCWVCRPGQVDAYFFEIIAEAVPQYHARLKP